jgi:hypothetical protein
MSSNHPELMASYPNPMLDFIPSAKQYAAAKAMENVGRVCGGLHFPDVLAVSVSEALHQRSGAV